MTRNLSGPRAFLPSATLWMALVFPNTAPALDFAPPGTTGTLTLKIEAAGTAKHKTPPGSGLDAREWIIKNSGQFTIRLKSVEPVGDISPENQAKAGAVRGAYEKTVTEKDQDIIDKWQEKSDACNSNEVCENRVQAQMMSDPAYQRIIQKMQGAGPEILAAAQAVNVGLRYQLWQSDPMDASPASGSLLLDYTKKEYGVIDTGGGGKVDGTCRWSGNLKIASGSAESKVGTRVLVDAKTSQYEIRIPAEAFGATLTEACADSKTGAHGPSKNTTYVPLIGRSPPRGVKDFPQLLTFKGPLGSVRSPQMSGKHTLTTEWLDASNPQPVPVKVTIEWQYSAGGR